jgi:hypothetical protein
MDGNFLDKTRHFLLNFSLPFEDGRFWANVAQLVEHLICNQAVVGSNPIVGFP